MQIDRPWTQSADHVLMALDVNASTGLSEVEAVKRREKYGANVLRKIAARSVWRILIDQFMGFLVVLLVAGSALSFIFGDFVDGVAILTVVVINAAIGFFTELRAVRSMESLRELGSVEVVVRRDQNSRTIPGDELVPGDIVIIDGGDIVTADMRLILSSGLQVDESSLTGESISQSKSSDILGEDVDLAERGNIVFKGTSVTRGHAEGVVFATGVNTELGRISELVREASDEETPLEKQLNRLGKRLAYVSIVFVLLVATAGWLTGKELLLVIETSIALLVATVPEGLPIVATIALARGMWRMAERNALINELSAVETLGSTNIILTDKTGTLTENQMTVTRVITPKADVSVSGTGLDESGEFRLNDERVAVKDHPILHDTLLVAALCTDATFDNDEATGDPMEIALIVAARKAGIWTEVQNYKQQKGDAFDPELRMMATYESLGDELIVAVKGAPEAVLKVCNRARGETGEFPEIKSRFADLNTELGKQGLRLLAVATKTVKSIDEPAYEGLEFLGLVGLVDPPRDDARDAMRACEDAGIRVVMVTGDQPGTASYVAEAVGLAGSKGNSMRGSELAKLLDAGKFEEARAVDIVARASPEQKLQLIAAHQEVGQIVAMIGDGVNDAPALRKADIGVAMGGRGTQVARDAAEMVLRDDRFGTIIAAIEEGRAIYTNIRKFVFYLVSCNLSEVLVVGLISLFNVPLPLLPLQILFLNLITDVFPALALGVGEGQPGLMKSPPREPGEAVLTKSHWMGIIGYSLLLAASVITPYTLALMVFEWDTTRVVTLSFLTLAVGQLFHVFNMPEKESKIFDNEVTRNRWVWAAMSLCGVLILGGVYIPGIRDVLGVRPPGLIDWGLIIGFAFIPLLIGRIITLVRSHFA